MDIINNLGRYSVDDGKDFLNFDKNHKEFREIVFINLIKAKMQKFESLVRFEGDEKFTLAKQKTMMRQTFIYGIGGFLNLNGVVRNAIINKIELPEDTHIIDNVALGISPSHWNEDNRVVRGTGMTNVRNNTSYKTFNITIDDTAILKADETGICGWNKWIPWAYMQATSMTVLKKRTATMDKKLVINSNNNSFENTDFDGIYDITTSMINLSPSQNSSLTGDDRPQKINVGNLMNDKIAKLDFTAQETVSELIDFIDANRNHWSYLFGERTNVNKKSERNISDEFMSDEVHFDLMELDFKDQVNMFVEDYKRIFGKSITPIFTIDEKIKELQEQAQTVAGGGQKPDNDKGEEDDK